jgi:hypothetical protein
MSDLETIFRILDYPKVKVAPDEESVVLARFTEDDYFYALRYFKALKLKAKTADVERTAHIYERAGMTYLVLAEKTLKKEETAQEH